ncbi:hypothetical protein Q8A73_003727 [Channa argus]|nr:hypothetical protein Q8A73_003727 [Channa argus]
MEKFHDFPPIHLTVSDLDPFSSSPFKPCVSCLLKPAGVRKMLLKLSTLEEEGQLVQLRPRSRYGAPFKWHGSEVVGGHLDCSFLEYLVKAGRSTTKPSKSKAPIFLPIMSAEKSPAPEKRPIYGQHSTRLKPRSRETDRERERERVGE